jgi:hypothetical protein
MMRSGLACALGLGVGAVGCAGLPLCTGVEPQYLLVERSESQLAGVPGRAEITETPTYKAQRSKFKTVVLRLPDNCFQRASLSEGRNGEAAILESTCGVPLQVLESTLTKAGYQVLSWSALMGIERQQGVPVHIAARQLGADLVIIVNAMYAGLRKSRGSADATYRYFASDSGGARRGRIELYQADRAWLKDFIRSRGGDDPEAQGSSTLQAELNATVVLAKETETPAAASTAVQPGVTAAQSAEPPPPAPVSSTSSAIGRSGESIWFYNWRIGKLISVHEGMRFLFDGIPASKYKEAFGRDPHFDASDPNLHYWWPVGPSGQALPEPVRDRATSEESFGSKVDVTPADAAVLYRRIAQDFIERFKGG